MAGITQVREASAQAHLKWLIQARLYYLFCIFIKNLPVMYAPFFAFLAADYSTGLALMMPVLFTVTLVSLDNIQLHLENPFDQRGEDDIHIAPDAFVKRLSA